MNKPLIAAVFGIALALGSVYIAFGRSGDSAPAVVTSVSVAPMSSGQDSQAKLAPLDPTLADTPLADIRAASQKLDALLQSATTTAPSNQTANPLSNDVQSLISHVQQAALSNTLAQNNNQSQVQSSANATSANGSNATSTSVTSMNGVTTTSVTTNGVTTTTTSNTPAAGTTAASDALAKAIDAYNQAVGKIGSLDLPPDIRQALMDYLATLRAQLLSLSVPDQLAAAQAAAMTNNPAVDALNAFLANVNNLSMTNGDKTSTFTALLAALANIPGVNTNFTLTPTTQQAVASALPVMPTMPQMPTMPADISMQTSAQIQAAIDKAMASLQAQQPTMASLQSALIAPRVNLQLNGMSMPLVNNSLLSSITATSNPAH